MDSRNEDYQKRILIGDAIKDFISERGMSQAEIAAKLDIAPPSLNQMLSGKSPIPLKRYAEILRILKLSKGEISLLNDINNKPIPVALRHDSFKKATELLEGQSNLRPVHPSQMTSIPIIGVAQALSFDRTLQSFDEFIADNSTGRAPAIGNMGDGMAAIAVDGTSMTPFYPDGTIVYFSVRQTPKNGDRVIAKLKKEQALVFKLFCKTNGHVELKSIDKDGKNFSFSNPADNPFEWIYPVKYSLRDEEALDRELDNHNIERLPVKD